MTSQRHYSTPASRPLCTPHVSRYNSCLTVPVLLLYGARFHSSTGMNMSNFSHSQRFSQLSQISAALRSCLSAAITRYMSTATLQEGSWRQYPQCNCSLRENYTQFPHFTRYLQIKLFRYYTLTCPGRGKFLRCP